MPEEFNLQRYQQLLSEAHPGPIETPEEHERLLSLAESLLDKSEGMAPEERRLAALLVLLIEAYEGLSGEDDDDEEGPSEPPAPYETLNRLLMARQLEPEDIAHFFGNIHMTRDILAGRREITNRQAKDLAKFFRVPAALFSR